MPYRKITISPHKYINFIEIKINKKKYQNNFLLSKLLVYLAIPKHKTIMEIIIFFIIMAALLIGLAGLCDYLTKKLK
jgi:hypothetical protein